ncbi:uncharacterized protein LOC125386994 [Bombus terrestris]|uniref:RNA-directed DNA polymerase n=1 Tax=Bombus terrestris TaxID=30195 RepID=A0A9C6SZ82_BOMTE|nr:uncharacterized protein LOC125386994 [Bombus terrestris]
MVPRHQEPQLVKLLMNKLRGLAFLAVEDCQIINLNDFGNKLKDMFGPGKTVNEYRGELGTVFQRPGEDILDYMDRVRNHRLAIMDGERCEYGTISQDIQKTIDWGTRGTPKRNVFAGLQGGELSDYLDDIVINSGSLHKQESKFNELMERLRQVRVRLQPDPKMIGAVSKFPRRKKNIKQFLGLAGYYRRFVPNFFKIAKTLTQLLKKHITFKWLQNQENAFNNLKTALMTKPILL